MFHDLKSLLHRNLAQAGLKKQVDDVNVVELFNRQAPQFLGARLARETQAVFIRDGLLTVQCTSSVVMQEVQYRQRAIVNGLNQKIGRSAVRGVRYTL